MTAPTPPLPTFTTGEVVTAAKLNSLSENIADAYAATMGGFLTDPPVVCATITRENVEIPTNVDRLIKFDDAAIDTDHMWSAQQQEYLVFNAPGIFRVGFSVTVQPATVPDGAILAARLSARADGAGHQISSDSIAADFGVLNSPVGGSASCTTLITVGGAGIRVGAWVTHTAGVTLALDPVFGGCRFWAVRVGPHLP